VLPPSDGNPQSSQQLFTELYQDLRRIAARELRRGGGGLTISPTTLLHEAYLSFSQRNDLAFPDRAHFVGYAARVLRGLMVDYARARQTVKRGAAIDIVALPTQVPEQVAECVELERVAAAMDALEQADPQLAQVVDLKYFCGFSFVEIAAMRGTHEKTVRRAWEKARIFLQQSLTDT
jgi:RNA polymerase sigma factor (TIGR02999 family)